MWIKTIQLKIIQKNLEVFESDTEGELVYKSPGSGAYVISPHSFFLKENELPCEPFFDPNITIKKLFSLRGRFIYWK